MSINQFTAAVIGAAIKVHGILGPGLLESAYRVCFAYELGQLELKAEQEKPIPVIYEGVILV